MAHVRERVETDKEAFGRVEAAARRYEAHRSRAAAAGPEDLPEIERQRDAAERDLVALLGPYRWASVGRVIYRVTRVTKRLSRSTRGKHACDALIGADGTVRYGDKASFHKG